MKQDEKMIEAEMSNKYDFSSQFILRSQEKAIKHDFLLFVLYRE